MGGVYDKKRGDCEREYYIYCMESATKRFSTLSYFLFALLCMVPLVGAIAGVVFIIIGASNRDKILIGTGIGGVLITGVVYGTLFYLSFSRDTSLSRAWDSFASAHLNAAIREVEFYKQINGRYPDNLDEVRSMDTANTTFVFDPSKGKGMSMVDTKEFYYSKQDSGYYLFSTGYDNTPFTEDDIYPAFSDDILSKTGFRLDKKPKNSSSSTHYK